MTYNWAEAASTKQATTSKKSFIFLLYSCQFHDELTGLRRETRLDETYRRERLVWLLGAMRCIAYSREGRLRVAGRGELNN